MLNRGKRGITLDLAGDGAETFRALLADADVVVENMRPGKLAKLGFSPEAMREIRPALVTCSISGVGDGGPERGLPGYDAVAVGLSGLGSQLTALVDPEPVGPPVADLVAGMLAAQRICAALVAARTTGRGRHVSASLLGAALDLQILAGARLAVDGVTPDRLTRSRQSQTYGAVGSDGGAFFVHLSTRRVYWDALAEALEHAEGVFRPDFATAAARVARYEEVGAALGAVFRERPRAHWLDVLARHDVPAAPILTLDEALAHPQVAFVREGDATAGLGPAPGLGQHHDEIARRAVGARRETP